METDIKSLPDFKIAEMLLSRLELAEISGNFAELIKEAARRLQSLQEEKPRKTHITPNFQFFKFIYERLVNVHHLDENSAEMIQMRERLIGMFGENGDQFNYNDYGYAVSHHKFFTRIYNKMVNELGENPNLDYMTSFKERIENLFIKRL
jgi:hypothetical protein